MNRGLWDLGRRGEQVLDLELWAISSAYFYHSSPPPPPSNERPWLWEAWFHNKWVCALEVSEAVQS